MKKLFVLFFMVYSALLAGQESAPIGTNFKSLPTVSFKYYTTDNTVWLYKGSTYGWTNLTKYANYRRLNDHDSLSTLQERSYSSLLNTPTFQYSLTYGSGYVNLVGDANSPGNNKVYGTNASGVKGWYDQSIASSIWSQSGNDIYYNTGNVGIGTTTTPEILTVSSTTSGIVLDGAGSGDPHISFGRYGKQVSLANRGAKIQYVYTAADSQEAGGLAFYTNPVMSGTNGLTERMRIINTGNVGIGTTAPNNKVDIQNADRTGTHSTGNALYVTANAGVASGLAEFRHSNGTQGIGIGYNTIYAAGSNSSQPLSITTKGGAALQLNESGGNVGIGTTSVTDKLIVSRNESNDAGGITIHNQNTVGWGGRLTFTGAYNGGYAFGSIETENHSTGGRFSIYTSNTSGTLIERIRWDNAGNTAMYGPLDVSGGISATSGNSTQWNAAYTHSQIAGGNSVHVSTEENAAWDAAYTHSQDNTQAHSDYLLNNGNDETSGTLTATNFILGSDERLKENIKSIQNLSNIRDIKLVQFTMKNDPGQLRYGVIAQEVEKFIPKLVRTDDEGMKSVAYIDLLVMKIADLEQRVLELEKKNKRLIRKNK